MSRKYEKASTKWKIYPDPVRDLTRWVDTRNGTGWGNLHPTHSAIVKSCQRLKPLSVCEVGAGAGVVAKYVFASLPGLQQMTCVEGSPTHMAQMERNFGAGSPIPPHIQVDATIVNATAQKLPFADRHFELTYTCTVIMHMPFVPAVLALCEIARCSSRYVVHSEGLHTEGICFSRRREDLLIPDYARIYQLLGFRTLVNEVHEDPFDARYARIEFIAERISPDEIVQAPGQ